MEPLEAPVSSLHPVEDQALLYPCFRFDDVKRALAHIETKMGLGRVPGQELPYVFFYTLNAVQLAIMITPMRFNADQMCYGFRLAFLDTAQQSTAPGAMASTWHLRPSDLYLELLTHVKPRDVKHVIESFKAKGLLPEHSSYLEPLDTHPSTDIEYSWQDIELLNTLELNGFPTPSYSEFTSLLFWKIKPEYLRRLARSGYNYFSVHELGIIWRHKIPTVYLEGLANAGYGRFSAEEYATLYASQVTPASVHTLSNQGHTTLSSFELVRMAQYGVCRLLPE